MTRPKLVGDLITWAKGVKRDALALWIAARDPRTPWHAKALAFAVAAYAFSPIDLIPDFIPVLGYLDDLIIVPLGILLVIRLIDPPLMAEFRAKATAMDRPVSRTAAVIFILIWIALGAVVLRWLLVTYRL